MTAKGKSEQPAKIGRPSGAEKLDLEQVEGLAAMGLTDQEIATFLKVSVRTLHRWKAREDFCHALKAGKLKADLNVTRSLYDQARGNPEKGIFPNVTAGIFWLKNRRPDLWRERSEVDHSGAVKHDGKLTIEVVETKG